MSNTDSLSCAGCGRVHEGLAFSCLGRKGADDIDHVLRWRPDAEAIRRGWESVDDSSENPFVRYRSLSYLAPLADSDEAYLSTCQRLSDAIGQVHRSPTRTNLFHSGDLGLWVKAELEGVSGSHKARHLIGTALAMELADRDSKAPLAIASCGNAALAAAVVAKAARRHLQVFVPPDADGEVIERLRALDAKVQLCKREDDAKGDPCYLAFRQAVDAGALPFSCQGGDNAMALIGGHTLGWEIVEAIASEGRDIDRIYVQVGGGVLAASIAQVLHMAHEAQVLSTLPSLFAVQTANCHPLASAWEQWQSKRTDSRYAASHRDEFMRPWPSPPKSIASGILDDETYDWLQILETADASHGDVFTVSEEELIEANHAALAAGTATCVTGSAGLAGFLQHRDFDTPTQVNKRDAKGDAQAAPETPFRNSLVLFTGTPR